jgi:hypothetical protein
VATISKLSINNLKLLCRTRKFGFGAEIERRITQFVHRKALYEFMARCLEMPASASKIVPRCVTQTLEKLFIRVRKGQMSVIFPKRGIIVSNAGIAGIERTRSDHLSDSLKLVATSKDPQPRAPYPGRSKQDFQGSAERARSIREIPEQNGAQASVGKDHTGGNARDDSFLGIEDSDQIAPTVNGHDSGRHPLDIEAMKNSGSSRGSYSCINPRAASLNWRISASDDNMTPE